MIWFENPMELAKRRREIGLSQRRLGELAGLSRSVVRNIERGQTKLRGDRADRLWDAICTVRSQQEQSCNAIADRLRAIDRGCPKLSVDAAKLRDFARQLEVWLAKSNQTVN